MKKFFTLSFFIILLLGFNYCSKLAANNNDTPVTETQTTSSSDVYNSSQSTSSQDLSSELLNSVPPGTIGLKPDEFKNMWNNFAIASNLKRIIISDLIVSEGELQNSCQFMFNDKIGLMATINKADGSIRDVTIISQPAGDKMAAMDTMAAWGALIYVTNPGLSPEERGKILSDLGILDVGQGQIDINSIDTSTIRGKIKYHLQVIKGIGIIFNASDSNDNDGQIQNKNNFVDDNKFIFKSEKGEESLNTSDNKSLMPEDLSYYPNKNIQAIRQIPEEFYNDENINKENVLDYILENPVNDDAEQIIRRTLIHNNIDTTFFDGMVRYNKENNLLEKAAEALEENDYRIYLWNKMRLEAIEFLDNINFINKNSKELMLPDSDIKEEIWNKYISNSYGEAQYSDDRLYGKGTIFLLDTRLWALETFWCPFSSEPTDAGYDTGLRVISDIRLSKLSDQIIRDLFAENYKEDDVSELMAYIAELRAKLSNNYDSKLLPLEMIVNDVLHIRYYQKITTNLTIEVIEITAL